MITFFGRLTVLSFIYCMAHVVVIAYGIGSSITPELMTIFAIVLTEKITGIQI